MLLYSIHHNFYKFLRPAKLRTAEEEVKKVLAEMEEAPAEEALGEEGNGF